MNTSTVLEDAKTILLNKSSLKYFGILSLGLDKEIVICKELEDDLILSEIKNKKILYYVNNENISVQYVVYATVYALLTSLHYKNIRSTLKNQQIFDIATAHVINRSIKHMSRTNSKIDVPPKVVYIEQVEKDIPDSTIEEVYDYLIQKEDTPEQQNESNVTVLKYKDKYMLNNDSLDYDIDDLTNRARNLWVSNVHMSGRGNLPEHISIMIESFLKIKIPWFKLLQNSLLYYIRRGRTYDWSIPNLILRRPKFKIAGHVDKKKSKNWLYISFDVSSSIGDEDLLLFCGVVMSTRGLFDKMKILYHNTFIIDEKTLSPVPKSDKELFDILSSFNRGGGTSHKDVFQHIENKKEIEKISSIIFITDFESDVESIYDRFSFTNTIPNIWIVKGNKKIEIDSKLFKMFRI